MTAQELEAIIRAGLPCTHLTVDGDGRHWYATIVSTEFEGKRPIARHQRVECPRDASDLAGERPRALVLLEQPLPIRNCSTSTQVK